MDTREQILTMGRNLPRGAKKEVAKLTGLTEQTIVKFFKTGTASPENALKIIEHAKPYYEQRQEVIKKKNQLLEQLGNEKRTT